MAITRTQTTYFSPEDDIHAALISFCREATMSLHLDIFEINLSDLIDVVIAKHQAGLATGICADKRQSAGKAQRAQLQRALDAGVPVTITQSTKSQIDHEKAAIRDVELGFTANESTVFYGSYNFSSLAQSEDNHATESNDPSLVEKFWLVYQDAESWGRQHPQWQLTHE